MRAHCSGSVAEPRELTLTRSRSAGADVPPTAVVTHSHPKPEPEWLIEYRASCDRAAPGGAGSKKAVRATVAEECPKCKNPTMEFFTMQLRSADEGQTVFYECPQCGHKFSINT